MAKQYSNKEKNEHGVSLLVSIENFLDLQKENGILDYEVNYRIGRKHYENLKQFFSPIKINFFHGPSWILFTSTSFRSDRFKGHEWDAYNLKKIDNKIKKAYLIYPDLVSEEEKKNFKSKNTKIKDKFDYSSFDGIMSQHDFTNYLENEICRDYNTGKFLDYLGRNFESKIVFILNYPANLEKYKTGKRTLEGFGFEIFSLILNELGIENIVSIHATDKIPKLPSGGSPKTDVLINIIDGKGNLHKRTLSLKRSTSNRVSVHEYPADIFADVLDSENEKLRYLLNEFQKAGSLKQFRLLDKNNEVELTKELQPYLDKLGIWVLSGEGGQISSEDQIAQYIMTYSSNTESIHIFTVEEYYQGLKQQIKPRFFGTVFSWTYPSKGKGKRIQLKLPILDEID